MDEQRTNMGQMSGNGAPQMPGYGTPVMPGYGTPVMPGYGAPMMQEPRKKKSGFGKGLFAGVVGTLLVVVLGIYITCRVTGSQIVIADKEVEAALLDADTISKLNELTAYIQMYYYEDDATISDLKDGMYAGLVSGLGDKYSVYYTADEYEQTQVSMTVKYY